MSGPSLLAMSLSLSVICTQGARFFRDPSQVQNHSMSRNQSNRTHHVDLYSEAGEKSSPLVLEMYKLDHALENPKNSSGRYDHLEVKYAPALCDDLFAYSDSRSLCKKLQPKICGRECSRIAEEKDLALCEGMQDTICVVPKPGPLPEPLKAPAEMPKGEKPIVVTMCHGFATNGKQPMWIGREGPGTPQPVVTKFTYQDCRQFHGWSMMRLGVYFGGLRATGRNCDDKNELMILGQSGLDDSEALIYSFSFPDEDMKRPILCHLAPRAPGFTVTVSGRTWYPFINNMQNLDGEIKYMQCEVLSLDHDDSLRNPETIEMRTGGKKGPVAMSFEVSPMKSLFLVTEDGDGKLGFKSFNLGYLKYK